MCQTVGSFAERGQLSLYRSILRVAVKKMDTAKPPRGFGDKAEWTLVLNALHQAGKLTYKVESDTITIIEACGRFSHAELADSIHEVLSLFTVKSDEREFSANQLLEHLQRTPGYRTLSLETMHQVCSLGITL